MRKALLAAVCVSAFGLSAPAFAQEAGAIMNNGTINGFNETDTSSNTTVDLTDSGNNSSDNSDNSTYEINDSGNNNSDNSTNTTYTVEDSHNDNSNTRTSTNTTVLTGIVTGATITFVSGTGGGVGGAGDQNGDFVSGNARIDTSGSYAGVQNSAANTGFATNVLVANGISANADISFGSAD